MNAEWTVAGSEAGQRLDKYLAAPERLGSRGRALAMIERGKIFLNGAETSAADVSRAVAPGDEVRLWMDRPGSAKRRPAAIGGGDVQVLFDDEQLMVLSKPAGLLAVPLERRGEAPSVFDYIEDHFRSRGKRCPLVVHRIDRDTSGVVAFAKDLKSQQHLRLQFKRREPERVYLAVVYGHPTPASGTWRDHLVWDDRALIQKETHPRDPKGKEAIADYRVLERFEACSLIEVRLVTGKRNQIRLQARLRGHTLVGEQRYVYGPDSLRPIPFGRQALHALRLRVRHPLDGRTLTFEAPLPRDMEELLEGQRAKGRHSPEFPGSGGPYDPGISSPRRRGRPNSECK
jgi:23S rRNA pseudouridine1911/1915/1917 synthase